MSDDLISRKWLMKQFCVSEEGRRIPEYDIDNFPVRINIKDVKNIIRKAPTAFDKEKVINEIKEYKEDAEEWANKSIENADEFYTYTDAYNNCLEIVERAGSDD